MSKASFDRQITDSGVKRLRMNINLFKKGSVESLISALESYKSSLPDMLELAVKRLVNEGYKVATDILQNSGNGDSDRIDTVEFDVTKNGNTVHGKLFVNPMVVASDSGTGFCPFLAWEFGAGIFYNADSVHPKAAELGMGVGTFNPNSSNAFHDGWFYRGRDGKLHYSHGTEATMPLYNASLQMIKEAERIIRGAFW